MNTGNIKISKAYNQQKNRTNTHLILFLFFVFFMLLAEKSPEIFQTQ